MWAALLNYYNFPEIEVLCWDGRNQLMFIRGQHQIILAVGLVSSESYLLGRMKDRP